MGEILRQVIGARHRGAILDIIVPWHMFRNNGNIVVPILGEQQSGCKTYDASTSVCTVLLALLLIRIKRIVARSCIPDYNNISLLMVDVHGFSTMFAIISL
jgi:hypothetical protein